MMNQICIAGLMQGLSEALAFGQKAGLDGEKVVEVISQGAAGAGRWSTATRPCWPTRSTSASRWTGCARTWICLATADEIGARLPVTALVDQFYKDVQLMGGGPERHLQPDPRPVAKFACNQVLPPTSTRLSAGHWFID
jgi:3-hydroxyisobutyrate dehydrogenase